MSTEQRGPKRTGTLYWTKSGWRGRVRVEVDGETVQRSFDLKTTDKQAARVKLRRLVKMNAPPTPEQAKAPVTVSEYAERWLARREALGIRATDYERRFFERVWRPAIGTLPLAKVGKAEIQDVLDAAACGEIRPWPRRDGDAPEPFSRQSVVHMRATIVRLLRAAWKDELVDDNKAARTDVPDIEQSGKARTVLTDDEIERFVASPKVDSEIKLLVLLSRTVGGLRAGDLNALDWSAFSPNFETCTVVRRKTRKKRPAPQTLIVPHMVRPFLTVWWEEQKKPPAGPVFPVRQGKRAGLYKTHSSMSYAERLRTALKRAGIDRYELYNETATTLPVDFHSTRRAYATALARVGVNEQTAMLLTGHSDPKVHLRYLQSMEREMPAAALPQLSINHAQLLRKAANKIHDLASFSERDIGFEPTTSSLGSSCSTN